MRRLDVIRKANREAGKSLGKVAEQDLGLFMKPLSDDEKSEVIEITAVWFKNYADAIQRAVKDSKD